MLRNELNVMSSALANMRSQRHEVRTAFERYNN